MKQRLFFLLETLFPPYCFGCEQEGKWICGSCARDLQPHPNQCGFCHRATRYGQTCPDCFLHHKDLQGIMVAFVYTETIKQLIMHLKFYHTYILASFLSQKLTLLIQTNPLLTKAAYSGTLYITCVPSHRRRKRFVKGYNQSELLAKQTAKQLGIPFVTALTKTKYTRSQVKLSRKQRLTNLLGAFAYTKELLLPPHSTLVLVDDITTTGSTLEQVAKVWKQKHPSLKIRGVVLGRHGK